MSCSCLLIASSPGSARKLQERFGKARDFYAVWVSPDKLEVIRHEDGFLFSASLEDFKALKASNK